MEDTRHADYFPQKPFESLPDSVKLNLYKSQRSNGANVFNGNPIVSDGYLKFIVGELKPFIDKTYRTKSDLKNTFIAGSSMGGLISIYAICEYPDVFGGAACLSTHWPGIFTLENNPIPDAIFSYLEKKTPDPANHKIYFDCGTETLDALYPDLQKKVDSVFTKKGYQSLNYFSKVFEGANHSEVAWKARMHKPLQFLLMD
jgi:predicted alpha/beta superfamily hydrolase